MILFEVAVYSVVGGTIPWRLQRRYGGGTIGWGCDLGGVLIGSGWSMDGVRTPWIPRDLQKPISQGKVQDFFVGKYRGIANSANPAVFVTPNQVKKRYLYSWNLNILEKTWSTDASFLSCMTEKYGGIQEIFNPGTENLCFFGQRTAKYSEILKILNLAVLT